MTNSHLLVRLGAVAALCFSAACSNSTGPQTPSVSGDWSGITVFPTQDRTSSMSLSQSGTSVTGTFSVAGAFADIEVTGTVDASGRFSFLAPRDCEVWGGTLILDGSSLSGPIVIDRSGCTAQSNGAATLNLTR